MTGAWRLSWASKLISIRKTPHARHNSSSCMTDAQVFANCRKYNVPEIAVRQWGDELGESFERQWTAGGFEEDWAALEAARQVYLMHRIPPLDRPVSLARDVRGGSRQTAALESLAGP